MKIEIKVQHRDDGDRDMARLRVFADGHEIADGMIGGEPEDNTIGRGYAWIVPAMKKIVEACGGEPATVTKEPWVNPFEASDA